MTSNSDHNQDLDQDSLPRRLLGVWAHPDDESYLAGDLMARTIESGGTVTLIVVTDGENGFGHDDPRPDWARAAQRRAELLAAMKVIGVDDVRFFGVADGGVVDEDPGPLVNRIATVIRRVQPDVITTFGPDGITGHADHVASGRLATQAWAATGIGDLWYATKSRQWLLRWADLHSRLGVIMTDDEAGLGHQDIDVRLTATGRRLSTKRRMLAAHGSQTELVARVMGEPDYRRWIAEEYFRRPTEADLTAVMDQTTATDQLVGSRS